MVTIKRKLYYGVLLAIIFAVIYSIVARLPHYISLNFSTSLDNSAKIIPVFVIFYLLAYIFPLVAFLIAESESDLKSIFKAFIIQLLISSIFFIAIPVAIVHAQLTTHDIFSQILIFIRTYLDTQWNAFPSHHVASAFLTFLIVRDKKPKYTIPIFITSFLIIISTLFTKQHVILDVLAGLILSTIIYLCYLKLLKK
ncbi:MAG TPA: phosphatase PAP2 family protein [Candidatus Nanoarchaeia archaeon]|nr:phosphatase PAP2 family protein [Candidatus Nanoarchaeia archaeon]